MNQQVSTRAGDEVKIYEASFVQRREWTLYKIKEDHYPFNLVLDFSVEAFDLLTFQRVIDLLVERHEILRTTLEVIAGSLKQIVHRADRFPVQCTFFDLTGSSFEVQEEFINSKKTLQASLPFNFEYGPLFRVAVFARGENQFKVNVVLHHVIFDQYSSAIFKRDAFDLWQGLGGGPAGNKGPEPAQYRSYAEFENNLLDTGLGDAHVAYWQAQLAQGVPRLQIIDQDRWAAYYESHLRKVEEVRKRISRLPCSDKRSLASVIRRYRPEQGGGLDYVYSESTLAQIAAFKQRSNSSLHSLFIASFVLALHRLSGQQRFGFDIPAARKMDGVCKHIIGWLAAGGVCFFDLRENSSAGAFLDYVDAQLFLLSKHCVYPFEVLGCDEEVPPGSFMPVLFSLTEHDGVRTGNAAGHGVVWHQREGATSCQNMDIFLSVYRNTCYAHIGYNSFLIEPQVLEAVMAEQELSLVRIIGEATHSEVIAHAGDTAPGRNYFN